MAANDPIQQCLVNQKELEKKEGTMDATTYAAEVKKLQEEYYNAKQKRIDAAKWALGTPGQLPYPFDPVPMKWCLEDQHWKEVQ
jgi:hypothetical protein